MIWTDKKVALLVADKKTIIESNPDFSITIELKETPYFNLDKTQVLTIEYIKYGLDAAICWNDKIEQDDSIGIIKNKIIRLEKKLYIYLNNLIIEKENEISRLKMARLELTEA